jgi:hypothetical protein
VQRDITLLGKGHDAQPHDAPRFQPRRIQIELADQPVRITVERPPDMTDLVLILDDAEEDLLDTDMTQIVDDIA